MLKNEYYWHNDILKADDELDWDTLANIMRDMAIRDLQDEDYYEELLEDDDAMEEAIGDCFGSMIVRLIYKDTILYDALDKWYEGKNELMEEKVRRFYDGGDYICFYTGGQYDWWSSDLCGGSPNGVAAREFEDFLNEKLDRGEYDEYFDYEDDEW